MADPAVIYETGFDMRRGEADEVVGHVTIQQTLTGARVIRHRYDALGLTTDQWNLTPDEAIELAGALEAVAKAVWAYYSESPQEGN